MATLRSALERSGSAAGCWVTIGHPTVAEVIAALDFDFLIVEREHAANDVETVQNLVRAIEATDPGVETIARLAENDPTEAKLILDTGVDGVLVPMVETPEDAREVASSTRFPPDGRRGFGGSRATGYGIDREGYLETAESLLRLVQIETPRGVENAAEIASIPAIDGLFIGPSDLSLAMGTYGDWEEPRFLEAIERVVQAGRGADIGVGTVAGTPETVAERLEWGVDFLVAGVDVANLRAGTEATKRAYEEHREHGRERT